MRLFAALCAACVFSAAQEIPPEMLLLARIRAHMLDQLHRQPNYTCLETVQRSLRTGARGKLEPVDTLRVEVALVGGKEMFSWPGASKFEDTDPSDFIRQGAIANGDFALHARAVFSGRAVFDFKGGQDGWVRYDFRMSQLASSYAIRVAHQAAVVAYHGSFFADPVTLDLRRLEVVAENIPESLGIAGAADRMEYARVKIGAYDFLLPAESELTLADRGGQEHVNHSTFTACHEFSGHSVVKFDDIANTAPSAPSVTEVAVPDDAGMELRLDDEIDLGRAAIGDPVRARLENDMKQKGRVLFRRGAMVLGRITRLERRGESTTVGLRFSEIDAGGLRGFFHAALERVAQDWIEVRPSRFDEGLLVLRGGEHRVGRGIVMFWRTEKS